MTPNPLIELQNLTKDFQVGHKTLRAVQQLNLSIFPGETLALVGESGCGKSTVAKTMLRLYEPTGGHIFYDGEDITQYSSKKVKALRRQMQIIFQDPYASLNPRYPAHALIGEALDIHKLAKGTERGIRIQKLLELVGLGPEHTTRFPHEFSGGQRQRIGIARALAVSPRFLVCDEPVSALDVSIQAQIITLLKNLQRQMNLTYLWITHDLSTLATIADRVAVMYLGNLVELAPIERFYQAPSHPYSKALLSAVPIPDPIKERQRSRIVLKGDPPSPFEIPTGCPFYSRCPFAMKKCESEKPQLQEVSKGSGQFASCFLSEPL